ncbi:hypothetical protein CYY_010351, partial [Polysphondylium violaceum]
MRKTTKTKTTIHPVINGDLLWKTPSFYDDLDLNDIFTFQLKPESFSDFKVPIQIKKLQIVVNENKDDDIGDLDIPVIPSTITDLDIHLDFDFDKNYDYSSIIKMIKHLHIPSSVVSLSISNKSMINGIDYVIQSILESDLKTTKKRKTGSGSGSSQRQELYDYFIPSSVTKLNVPWVSKEMRPFIPPTVEHLVFHIEKISFNIPNTVKHVEIVTNCAPKVQKAAFFSKLPKEIQTLTIGNHFRVSKVPLIRFRFNLDHFNEGAQYTFACNNVSRSSLLQENIVLKYWRSDRKQQTDATKALIFDDYFREEKTFPTLAKNIYFESWNASQDTYQFNNVLEYLIFNSNIDLRNDTLPQTLKYLFIKSEVFKYGISFGKHVPSSVSHLEITLNECLNFNGFIPQGVRYLKINTPTTKSKHQINIKIPSTLVHLQIDKEYIVNIKFIHKDEYYNSHNRKNNLGDLLNTSITKLDLTNYSNHYIPPYSLPPNLEEIIFGKFTQPIERGLIPATVKRITFRSWGVRFKSINFNFLPNHLSYFKFIFPIESSCRFEEFMWNILTEPSIGQVVSVKKKGSCLVSIKIKDLEFYTSKDKSTSTQIDIAKFKFVQPNQYSQYCLSFCVDDSDIPPHYKPKKLGLVISTPTKVDESIYNNILESEPKVLNLLNYQSINPSLLPKELTNLTVLYETNQSFLLKPKQEIQNQDDSKNRFTYSKPLKPDTELFFYIWKNTYIRNIIIDQLLHPYQCIVQVCPQRYSNTELVILDSKRTPIRRNLTSVSKIHLTKTSLSTFESPFRKSVLKLMDVKYHVYQKTKSIPSGTTHIIWPLNEPIPAGLLPDTILSITFGNNYNQPILPNTLGDNILEIEFGEKFAINIENFVFPPRLRYLTFGINYRYPFVPKTLPSTLKHIYFKRLFQESELFKSLKYLPPSVDHLGILEYDCQVRDFTTISPFIKYIKLGKGYYYYKNFLSVVIPSTIQSVWVPNESKIPISQKTND